MLSHSFTNAIPQAYLSQTSLDITDLSGVGRSFPRWRAPTIVSDSIPRHCVSFTSNSLTFKVWTEVRSNSRGPLFGKQPRTIVVGEW